MEHFGGAGHSSEILKRLSTKGILIGIDRDLEALEVAKKKLEEYPNVIYVHNNHDQIRNILEELKIEKVDGILLDLGVSSYQIDEKSRGFSYIEDSPLDMRMDKTQKKTAKEVVNTYKEEELARILYEYGEEKKSRQIARHICEIRKKHPLETTQELVEVVRNVIPNKKELHPEKRTFQAIRIEVNNEIEPLFETVKQSIECLKPKGRLCVITFHSLEDRSVKKAMVQAEGVCTCPKDLPYCVCGCKSEGKMINKKPIEASIEEQKENTRSKSAKLRIFEKQ